MQLAPYLLDQWLAKYGSSRSPILYDLASSAGPTWTLRELLALGNEAVNVSEVVLGDAPPDGDPDLRGVIAALYDVDPEWVVVTSGASEAIAILLCISAQPDHNVLIPNPAFTPFEVMAQAWGLQTRRYELSQDNGYRQDADQILAASDHKTVLTLVNTPHNLAGTVLSRCEISELAAGLRDRGTPLVVDEAHHPVYSGTAERSAAGIENVIVIGDMAKVFSLPGLRLGWIVDPDGRRRKRIVDARSYFTMGSAPLLERIGTHALANRDAILTRLRSVASANLTKLASFMESQAGILSWVKPQAGTIAFPWVADGRNARPICMALADAGVLVVPGDCFRCPDHLRVGFAARAEGFEVALSIFAETLRKEYWVSGHARI